jgi:hypothetical protein
MINEMEVYFQNIIKIKKMKLNIMIYNNRLLNVFFFKNYEIFLLFKNGLD